MVNLSAMFDEDSHGDLVSNVFTRSKCDARTEGKAAF